MSVVRHQAWRRWLVVACGVALLCGLPAIVGALPVREDGPVRVYHLAGALPLFYGVTHPVISTLPIFSDGFLGNVDAMAQGRAEFNPPSRSTSPPDNAPYPTDCVQARTAM